MTGISSKPAKSGGIFEHYQNETSKDIIPVLLISDEEDTEDIPDGFNRIARSQIKDHSFSKLETKTIKKLGIDM